jgi:hypothetical protein
VHVFEGAALGDDAGAAELQVEVLDIEAEDFLGAGGRVVQQPLPQSVRGVGEQLVQPGGRDGAVTAPGAFGPPVVSRPKTTLRTEG